VTELNLYLFRWLKLLLACVALAAVTPVPLAANARVAEQSAGSEGGPPPTPVAKTSACRTQKAPAITKWAPTGFKPATLPSEETPRSPPERLFLRYCMLLC